MYVRISRAKCDPSKCDEVLAAAQEVNPALRQLPGFQSSYWAVDRASGAMLAVSTWDTREHAGFVRDALASAGAPAAASRRMVDAGAQMDPPEIYEIAVHTS
jgi:heme-degrading monooxygenase HmoA